MAHERILPIMHTHNFRDLGGYKTTTGQIVKWGHIFRADKLDRLSKDDQAKLIQLNIKFDIDLRSKEEIRVSPDRLPDQVQYLFNPVFAQDVTDSSKNVDHLDQSLQTDPQAGLQHIQNVYHEMATSNAAAAAFQVIFKHLLSNDGGIVFHCTAGKDRTGMSAYLILRALGVDEKVAKKDYLLTNTALKNFLNGQQAMLRAANKPQTLIDNYTALWTAHSSYLSSALSAIKDHYQDVYHYLTEAVGLSRNDIIDLRKLYLS
ncbi:tyrosine-protein phosphatase [Limosilactobacillus coleohominis]|uniref:Tyrosine-protein phosphatase n=2 Tax=Limosilactobacillus coleohominis TaxID=181675 RepID=A0ABS2GZT7_9LACO|nr:tyrosine-protein phosphatase [Limosilactobacillus coleohominis]MBM6940730.1 tyrosine-protein phosphatase [Limosilactobacillus coleohominis]MBM6954528.1 tyrosine-protein phosphatase [Limosilactobacillus coleohominis]